jgi:hypothetical protein
LPLEFQCIVESAAFIDKHATPRRQGRLIDMTKQNWILTALTVLPAVVLFGIGVKLGQGRSFSAFSVQLRDIQATLLFDRIFQERGIKSLLTRGCVTEAIGEISNNELADRKRLADFVREELNRDTLAYINKRDSNILNELDYICQRVEDSMTIGSARLTDTISLIALADIIRKPIAAS